jgi:hypothetical protein
MMHTATECLKFSRLVRRLRKELGAVPVEPETIVVGLLERLWHLAIREQRDGRIGEKFNAEDIAELLGWLGDPQVLIDALVDTRWLDADSSGVLCIHDWDEHKPNFLKGIDERKRRSHSCQANSTVGELGADPSTQLGHQPGSEPGSAPSRQPGSLPGAVPTKHTKQNLTQPNETEPYPTQPNQNLAAAAWAEGAAAAGFDFGCLADTESHRTNVIAAAKKLSSASGNILGAEYLWRLAWVAEGVSPGFCSEMATKIRSGELKNYKRYLDAALRGELAARGVSLVDCQAHVPRLTRREQPAAC